MSETPFKGKKEVKYLKSRKEKSDEGNTSVYYAWDEQKFNGSSFVVSH